MTLREKVAWMRRAQDAVDVSVSRSQYVSRNPDAFTVADCDELLAALDAAEFLAKARAIIGRQHERLDQLASKGLTHYEDCSEHHPDCALWEDAAAFLLNTAGARYSQS